MNEWEEEFDKSAKATDAGGEEDRIPHNSLAQHLLRSSSYESPLRWPESPYELDPDKVKEFIKKLLKEERDRACAILEAKKWGVNSPGWKYAGKNGYALVNATINEAIRIINSREI